MWLGGRCSELNRSSDDCRINGGEVVSVVAPNVPAMYELHFAVPMARAVLNTVNTRLDARTVSVMLRHAESKLVFVDLLSAGLVLDAVSLFPGNVPVPRLVLIADESEKAPAVPPVGRCHRFSSTYEEMVERGDPGFRWVRPESEWDPMHSASSREPPPSTATAPPSPTTTPSTRGPRPTGGACAWPPPSRPRSARELMEPIVADLRSSCPSRNVSQADCSTPTAADSVDLAYGH